MLFWVLVLVIHGMESVVMPSDPAPAQGYARMMGVTWYMPFTAITFDWLSGDWDSAVCWLLVER